MKIRKTTIALLAAAGFVAMPLLAGCDRTVSQKKETQVKTKKADDGSTIKTTETEEKKVEKIPPK